MLTPQGTVVWLVGGVPQDEDLFTTTHSTSRVTRSILTLESVEKQDSKVQCQVTFGAVTVKSDEVDLVVYGKDLGTGSLLVRGYECGLIFEMCYYHVSLNSK